MSMYFVIVVFHNFQPTDEQLGYFSYTLDVAGNLSNLTSQVLYQN